MKLTIHRVLKICFVFTLLIFSWQLFAAENELSTTGAQRLKKSALEAQKNANLYYDEMFEVLDDGTVKVRPQYDDVLPIYFNTNSKEAAAYRKKTLKAFKEDNALARIPRVVPKAEFEELKKGVEQLGKTILLFLQDHYSGKKSYIKEGIIPENVINRIIQRSGELGFAPYIDPKNLTFPFGPDLMRDKEGKYRLVEVNAGFVGGPGDLLISRQELFKNIPSYKEVFTGSPDPEQFYKNLIERHKKEKIPPNGINVFYTSPPYGDSEELRLKKIWKDHGFEVVTPNTQKKLVIEKDGAYVRWQEGNKTFKKRVGFIILNGEYGWLDPEHPAVKQTWLYQEAINQLQNGLSEKNEKKLTEILRGDEKTGLIDFAKLEEFLKEKSDYKYTLRQEAKKGLPGLTDLVLKRKVGVNYSPGFEFIGDKEFYTYMEDLVRFYLHEEPIIPIIPTERMYITDKNGKVALNKKVYKKFFENLKNYVAKPVDGRGGDGVFIGPKMNKAEIKEAEEVIKKNFDRYIMQKFMHFSVLAGDIVDNRIIAQVGPIAKHGLENAVSVSYSSWSRGTSMTKGNGKVNISDAGYVVPYIIKDLKGDEPEITVLGGKSNCVKLFGDL